MMQPHGIPGKRFQIPARMLDKWRKWRMSRHLKHQLYQAPDSQLSDLGLERRDLDSFFEAGRRVPRLMRSMMKRHGIEPSDVPLSEWHDMVAAQQTCRHCDEAADCRKTMRWGQTGDLTGHECPNRDYFAAAAEDVRLRRAALAVE